MFTAATKFWVHSVWIREPASLPVVFFFGGAFGRSSWFLSLLFSLFFTIFLSLSLFFLFLHFNLYLSLFSLSLVVFLGLCFAILFLIVCSFVVISSQLRIIFDISNPSYYLLIDISFTCPSKRQLDQPLKTGPFNRHGPELRMWIGGRALTSALPSQSQSTLNSTIEAPLYSNSPPAI